jgi:general secretion pathway protein G
MKRSAVRTCAIEAGASRGEPGRWRGFTLIEMMIVIAVIAILIGVLLPQFRGTQDEAAEQRARSELRTLATAVESYAIHNNNTPPSALSGLTTAAPRIVTVIPDDPFRSGTTDYSYARDSNSVYYVIYSYGRDRAADISGIATDGELTESGDCTEDIFVTNGTRTDESGNSCGS